MDGEFVVLIRLLFSFEERDEYQLSYTILEEILAHSQNSRERILT